MIRIESTDREYVVSFDNTVIGCAVQTPAGEWLGATVNPATIQRHASRDAAEAAINHALMLVH